MYSGRIRKTSINSRPLLQPDSEQDDDVHGHGHMHHQPPQHIDQDILDEDALNSIPDDFSRKLLPAPRDRYHFTYITFYLLGMTTLMPWNFFVTPEDYWMYKFRNLTANATIVPLTPMQVGFTSDLNVASCIPNTIFLIVNAFLGNRIPLTSRITTSLAFILFFFITTSGLVEVNTDAWQTQFFNLTMLIVALMNVAAAFLCGGVFGVSGLFPTEYVTAVVSGQALGGIFSAVTEIISLTFGASPKTSAFVYFNIGTVCLLLTLILYLIMSRTAYFKYHTIEKLARSSFYSSLVANSSSSSTTQPDFYLVLQKVWIYGFAQWFLYVVTVTVYPSLTVLVLSQNFGKGFMWNDLYFLPVVNYLIFNSFDYFGRMVAGMLEWPFNRPVLVAFLSIARLAFVPAFMLCNVQPRHNLPVLIHSDLIYIALIVLFAFSNGYLTNISLIWAPKTVHNCEKEMASSMMAAFLGIGLAFGAAFALILVRIV